MYIAYICIHGLHANAFYTILVAIKEVLFSSQASFVFWSKALVHTPCRGVQYKKGNKITCPVARVYLLVLSTDETGSFLTAEVAFCTQRVQNV